MIGRILCALHRHRLVKGRVVNIYRNTYWHAQCSRCECWVWKWRGAR